MAISGISGGGLSKQQIVQDLKEMLQSGGAQSASSGQANSAAPTGDSVDLNSSLGGGAHGRTEAS